MQVKSRNVSSVAFPQSLTFFYNVSIFWHENISWTRDEMLLLVEKLFHDYSRL